MEKYKKYLNKYTYLLIGLIVLIVSSVLFIIPNFETEEFSQEVIEDIVEGITTTTVVNNEEDQSNISSQEVLIEEDLQISEEEKVAIQDILIHNKTEKILEGFNTYLLIGSDERSGTSVETRGKVDGKRADVIILGLIDKESKESTLLSFPRDLLVENTCTQKLERINAAYVKNACGNSAENLAAAIYSISGIKIDHFASFDFEGFEEIIDSVDGIEICVDVTQKEGYSFELQKGCQNVNGLATLNWVVSRSTEVLVGEKKVDANGNDNSEWKLMPGVSDLTRITRQQYVVVQLINELKEFKSVAELNKFIKALENTFVIDENLTINKAVELLWGFRDFDLSKIKKITTPVDYLTLNDGRQVLVLNQNLYEFLVKESVIDS